MRLIPASELTPISADVDPTKKRVEVSLDKQELTAYEDTKVVLKTKISSGLDYQPLNEIPYNTPTGTFYVENKMISKHMYPSGGMMTPLVPVTLSIRIPAMVSGFSYRMISSRCAR